MKTTPSCSNLRERFGRRYRIEREESCGRIDDPWLLVIVCRFGHIFPHGGNILAPPERRRNTAAATASCSTYPASRNSSSPAARRASCWASIIPPPPATSSSSSTTASSKRSKKATARDALPLSRRLTFRQIKTRADMTRAWFVYDLQFLSPSPPPEQAADACCEQESEGGRFGNFQRENRTIAILAAGARQPV